MKLKSSRSKLQGSIAVPGSKSHTIRAIAVATAANGTSYLRAPLTSADTLSALQAAQALGASVDKQDNVWVVTGVGNGFKQPAQAIDMGNSGTSLRIFTGLAATCGFPVTFDGDNSLRSRPMGQLLDALSKLNVKVDSANGKCPLTVTGPLSGAETTIDGTSSQFLTSLLFACPLAPTDTIINVVNLNEKPYVEITLDWLDKQGIAYEQNDDMTWFSVKGNQQYQSFDLTIPADFSTATFPLVAAAVTQCPLEIKNLDFADRQGDKATFTYLEQMGMVVERGSDVTKVIPQGRLKGTELDLNATPDALPAMAVAAACAEGRTVLGNVPQARIKECDRIAAMTAELRKLGIEVEELDDGMVITGGTIKGAEVEGYDDHRMVMALTIAGLTGEGETIVTDAEAAAVTYPNFIADFQALGAQISTQ